MQFLLNNHLADPGNSLVEQGGTEDFIHPQHETNTSEGGEFLADGIRIHEQPYEHKGQDPGEIIS